MGPFASTLPGTIAGPGSAPDLTTQLRFAFAWLDLQRIVVCALVPPSFCIAGGRS
jgi:hypothetical protein